MTVGRQNTLELIRNVGYDPQSLAPAFSLFGYSGFGAGAGDTEAGRWDNSVKYAYQYGPLHEAAMYTNGGQDTGTQNGGYGFNIGGKIQGLSIDAVYAKEFGAVSVAAPFGLANLAGGCGGNAQPGCNTLSGTISDNQLWSVQGKYTFELGGGGYKDEGSGAKLTVFAGFENVTFSNPDDIVNVGSTTVGGYITG